ncbi:MAG: glycosyltransferase family 2 protein [Actinobacteria bacterium]|nr:glycosyltransferase family 2 protein [Actinomycetota bacterium]
MPAAAPALSVVVPVYDCADCMRALHARLAATLDRTVPDWEAVYVDDRSPDASWPLLLELARSDRRVRALRLTRNFGQSAATYAGLAHSEGERIVVMDCDLQDPPEAIPQLRAAALEGAEVVLTTRPEPSYGPVRRLGTAAYLKLRRLGTSGPQPRYSNFSLISREAARAVLAVADRGRSYLMTLCSLELPSTALEVPREDRHAGESSYTLRRLVRVGFGNLWTQYRGQTAAPRPRGPLWEVEAEAPAQGPPSAPGSPKPEPAGSR